MTNNEVIIDYTQCRYNTFDGGDSQRTICSLDNKYCDCLRDKDCYYKQLQRKTAECKKLKKQLDIAKMAYEGCLANKEGRHKREIEKLKSALEEIEEICNSKNLKYNLTAVSVLEVIERVTDV